MTIPSLPRVALLTPRFLPYSQTFIAESLPFFARYEPEVFARERLNADRFAHPHVFTLTPGSLRAHAEALRHRLTGFSPSFLARMRARRHVLLHAQFGHVGLSALPYQAALKIPLVVTFRGHDVAMVGGGAPLLPPWRSSRRRRLFRQAAVILAVSSDLARRVVALGAPPARVRVWHVGVRIPERLRQTDPRSGLASGYGRPDPPVQILMAGRFVEKKGFEHGLEAVARLREAGRDARLTIVGAGPRGGSYRRLARRLGLEDHVTMPGVLAHRDLLERVEAADIVMVPSVDARDGDREGIPNILKEASARAVPVVATRHGGIPEAVEDGRTGLLVPEGDAAALADAISRLASDPDLRRRLGEAGREKMAREFDVRRQVALLEDLYDEVLEDGTASSMECGYDHGA